MSERPEPPKRVHLKAGGVAVAVVPPTPSIRDAIMGAWRDCLDPDASEPVGSVTVELGERLLSADPDVAHQVMRGPSATEILHDLSQAVTSVMLGHLRGLKLLLHAGAVSDGRGNVLAFVGRSGAGKTTLMSRLSERFDYVTDETLILDRDLRVVPYPKPLSIIAPDGFKEQAAVSALGGRVATGPLSLRGVWLLDRLQEPTPASLTPIASIDALPLMAEQSSWIHLNERPLHWLAAAAGSGSGAQVVRYAEAADVVPLVAAGFERHAD